MSAKKIGRIALRVEGEYWVGYWASTETMDGALELGRIRMSVVRSDGRVKPAFMALMTMAMDSVIEEKFGEQPAWGEPERAPEHERRS